MSLITVIAELKSDMEFSKLSEADISQSIRRVFTALGWDADNRHDVKLEYAVANRRVDYALLIDDAPQVFVEVKKGGEPLEKHQEQLLDYAFKEGIQLAVLTNGSDWWFYLPLQPGSWDQRRFISVSINKDTPTEIADLLSSVIGKENIGAGKAFDAARLLHESNRRGAKIAETLPKAWEALLTEPDELLVDLIAYETQALCGETADTGTIRAFLKELPDVRPPEPPGEQPKRGNGATPVIAGAKPTALVFNGTRYPVFHWKECLVRLCEVLASIHKGRFADVLTVPSLNCPFGRRSYFSRRESELKEPLPIGDTGIYVHTFVDSHQVKRLTGQLANHFGHDPPVIEEAHPP